jgi:glutamate dehydrogenase
MGPTFVHTLRDKTGRPAADVTRAYAITRGVFGLRELWSGIQALDNKVPAAVQTAMLAEINRLAERATLWFLAGNIRPLDIAATIDSFAPGIARLAECLDDFVGDEDESTITANMNPLTDAGVPDALARRIASLEFLAPGLDIVRMAQATGSPVDAVARTYFAVGDRFDIDFLRDAAELVPEDSHWSRLAVTAIVDDLYSHQRDLTARVLASNGAVPADAGGKEIAGLIDSWTADRGATLAQTDSLLAELRKAGSIDLAMLAVANRQLRSLIGA